MNFQLWIVRKEIGQSSQVLTLDIRCDVKFPSRTENSRQVSHSGAKFQNAAADKGLNHFDHPVVESPGKRHRMQYLLAGVFIYIVRYAEPQNREERVERIAQTDLFAFFVSAAAIADRHLENACATFSQLYRDFRLESESIACQGNALEQ